MNEDEFLDAFYEDRYDSNDYADDHDEGHDDRDDMLERQELEDFERCDEYYGSYGEE